jgi:hypothetical protein
MRHLKIEGWQRTPHQDLWSVYSKLWPTLVFLKMAPALLRLVRPLGGHHINAA